MKRVALEKKFIAALLLGTAFLAGCSDDEDFAPVSKNRGYDYALKTTKEFADYPCNEMREGREAIVGREKDSYYCQFDYRDSVYIWAGYDDTLTAYGKEFVRADASSSSRESSSSYDDDDYSSSFYSSSSYRSSSSYSSNYSSSSYRSSSSYHVTWSSANPASSFSVSSKEYFFNPDLTYGTMKDPRDGKIYRTIQFNGQTWMAENLNFSDSTIVPLLEGHNTCYHEEESECELMGRMYSRDAAMNSTACSYKSGCSLGAGPIQGICPDGWHVLTYTEAKNLIDYVGSSGGDKIKSPYGWGSSATGTNEYGLSFVAPGSWEAGNYDSRGGFSYTWVYYGGTTSQYYLLIQAGSNVSVTDYSSKEVYFPVRCIKDGPVSSSSSSSSSARSSSSSYSSSSSAKSSSSSVALLPYSSSAPRAYTYKESSDIYTVTEPETRDDYFNPNIDYGTMTDLRDGKTYKTVEVLGRTWMAENLNYTGHTTGRSTCYKDSAEMCDRYGRSYSRAAAMNTSTCAYNNDCDPGAEPVQGICPTGWHIPSEIEIWELVLREKGNATPFMSAYGWVDDPEAILPGENTYGLSFLGAGPKDKIGLYAYMWVSHYDRYQHYFIVQGQENHVVINNYGSTEIYASVRCIKDE